jgi:hypothetical protein
MSSRTSSDGPNGDFAADARWQLIERIAASTALQKSVRLRELLFHLARQSLKSQGQDLTEYQIGRAVFGKPADYNPLEDSSVRVHMRQLRLKLDAYFENEGKSETLFVEIPKGSHIPAFRERPAPEPVPAAAPLPPPVAQPKPAAMPVGWIVAAAIAVVFVLLLVMLLQRVLR